MLPKDFFRFRKKSVKHLIITLTALSLVMVFVFWMITEAQTLPDCGAPVTCTKDTDCSPCCEGAMKCTGYYYCDELGICDPTGSGSCSCSFECGAECETDLDCPANECSKTYNDYCKGKKLVEYDNDEVKDSTTVTDSCENSCTEACECTECETDCSPPETNEYCVEGVCEAECDENSDCKNKCDGTTLYYNGKCETDCTCSWSSVDCTTQCGSGYQAYAHYTGCSSGSCTGLTCTKGVCGADCDDNSDCPSSCTGTCGTGTDSCMWKVGNCPLSGATIHICVCHYPEHDPDEAQSYCTGCGQKWNLGGSGDCTGESCLTGCCGDDSGEKYRYCQAGTGFPDSGTCTSTDDTCCDNANDCVDTVGTYCTTSGTNATDGDGDGDSDYCLNGVWYDCYNDEDCPVEHNCVSNDCVDNTINGGSGTVCDASNPCFYIKDSTGTVKARFDDNGYIDVKGGYYSGQGTLTPPSSSFIIKDSGGTVRLYIDSSGNLYTRGYFYKQSSPSPSGGNDFIIKDSSGTVVGYIDGATGNMYFKGQLHYNSNF